MVSFYVVTILEVNHPQPHHQPHQLGALCFVLLPLSLDHQFDRDKNPFQLAQEQFRDYLQCGFLQTPKILEVDQELN